MGIPGKEKGFNAYHSTINIPTKEKTSGTRELCKAYFGQAIGRPIYQ